MSAPPTGEQAAATQRLLAALKEARQKLEDAERFRSEPIAVIGMSCRFPGGANDPEAFWELLHAGRDAIREVPASRWDVEAYYDPDPAAVGKTYVRSAGLLDAPIDEFDPHFFGISPREATSLDPQQRLLLEVSWEALEHAGQAPSALAGTRAGVFVGIGRHDYLDLIAPGGFLGEDIGIYGGTGNGAPFASGRLSYLLGLHGPNIALDTACSSSLVAVHLAVMSLRLRECELALAGGVQLMLSPAPTLALSRLGALAADGRSKAFDAAADGFSRGEGCGVIILKRLSDAVAAGDNILALVRGSAINHDGHSSGLTVPSERAQEQLIRLALQSARIEPDAVHYVETHGTGTSLGDPIELGALGAVFGRRRRHPLVLGAVKTNIGHLEAAAGIAGLIKTVLALQHDEIPGNLHYRAPNPRADWDSLAATVPGAPTAWPVAGAARTAGVSSFGMGGTNAHIVLGAAPVSPPPARAIADDAHPHLLTLSAKSEPALRTLAGRYARHLATTPNALADICHTTQTGRTHFAHRLALSGRSKDAMREELARFAAGNPAAAALFGTAGRAPGPVAFLCTGQGAQYVGMGQELYQSQTLFRQALDRCAELLRGELDAPLHTLLFPSAAEKAAAAQKIDQTAYTQPALFALEYALAQLWLGLGVEPDYVLGHSVGEYVAACLAGVFELQDGLRLIAARGRLMQALPASGEMRAVMAPAEQVAGLLQLASADGGSAAGVEIAALNGPRNVVIAGARERVRAAAAILDGQGIRSRALAVSHAFHTHQMEPMLAPFAAVARTVRYAAPRRALISNLTGALATDEIATADYWVRHVRQPVRFAASVAALRRAGVACFVELGPKPTLLGMVRECLEDASEPAQDRSPLYVPSLRQGQPELEQVLTGLGSLYVRGVPIGWKKGDAGARRVVLPTYPFQRERYWVEPRPAFSPEPAAPNAASGCHPLLGRRQRSALQPREWVFDGSLGRTPDYLKDHRVRGEVIVPAAAYVEMALAAGRQYFAAGSEVAPPLVVEQLTVPQALVLADGSATVVQLVLSPPEGASGPGARFQIFSLVQARDGALLAEPVFSLHATGRVARAAADGGPPADEARAPRDRRFEPAAAPAPLHTHYQRLQDRGLAYGPSFQVVEELVHEGPEVWGRLRLLPARDAAPYVLHPLVLDGCFQLVAALAPEDDKTYLPAGCERIAVHRSPRSPAWALARRQDAGQPGELRFDLSLFDAAGLCVKVTGLSVRAAPHAGARPTWRDWLYELAWRPQPLFLPPDGLAAPAEVVAGVDTAPDSLLPAGTLPDFEALIPRLESASVGYIVAALRQLGFHLPPGHRITTANPTAPRERSLSVLQLADELGIALRHRLLWSRLLAILAEAGYLHPDQAGFVVARDLTAPAAAAAAATSEGHAAPAERVLLDRCGASLAAALQGRIDPLALLFPGGDLSTTAAIYQHSGMAQLANGLAQKVVQAALQKLPGDRGLRILEVGAGTGGTTAYVVPQLAPERTRYVFTDVSQHFLNQAQEKFSAYGFMQYRTLDIERSPLSQGFAPHSYDLLLASNVLHATADLKKTLAHVRDLLTPGGLLILVEATTRRRWVDLTFGLTEGWWRFTDAPWRTEHPLLSAERWCELLRCTGFSGAQALTPSAILSQTVIVAQAGGGPERLGRPWLIFADGGGLGEELARKLAARGEQPTLVYRPEEPARPAVAGVNSCTLDLTAADARLPPSAVPWHGVVHLWPLAGSASGRAACESDLDDELPSLSQRVVTPALHLLQGLARTSRGTRLFVVTRGAAAPKVSCDGLVQAELWGLGRVALLEHPELGYTAVDLDPEETATSQAARLFAELFAQDAVAEAERQIALRKQGRYVARLAELGDTASGPGRLVIGTEPAQRGSLDALELRPCVRRSPGAGEVEVRVQTAGLNFRDVLNVLDLYEGQPPLGGECAGVVVAVGQGVVGLAPGDAVVALALGSFAEYVTVDARLVAPVRGLDFVAAATLPTAFVTARLSLQDCAGLRPGERVLIHAGAGGVGQAAIQLAQQTGAEVFATASPDKWEALRALGVRHLYSSRTLDFADALRADTASTPRGAGVDVVLNSLTGPGFVEKSLSLLRPGGRFLELAQRGIWTPEQVWAVRPDVSYRVLNVAQTIAEQPASVGEALRAILQQAAQGALRPLPSRVFPLAQAAAAFRLMQQARHVGKIVLSLPARPELDLSSPAAAAAFEVRADGSYLITGGLGGLGLLVAAWLVERGARHLWLVGRSTPGEQAQAQLAKLRAAGATVVVAQVDVAQRAQLAAVLARAQAERPLRGIFHSVGILDDGVLLRQSWARFAPVLAPKVQGAWHLHALTKELPLDCFVLFSSAASLLGSAGQANHASANAFLDALAHYRRSLGLPAVAINWGAWSEVGAAAQRMATLKGLEGVIAPQQGIAALGFVLSRALTQVGVVPLDRGRRARSDSFFQELAPAQQVQQATAPATTLAQLRAARPHERYGLLEAHISATVAKVLGIRNQFSLDEGFFDLGMDSLTSVELRNRLQQSLGRELPSTLTFDYPTGRALVDYLAGQLFGSEPLPPAPELASPAAPTVDSDTDSLTADEIALRLAEKLGIELHGDD